MSRTWSVAKLTFFLLLRRGGGWLMLALPALVGVFIFSVSQADGELLHELQLRSQYALHFASALLGLGLLWTAVISMRGDIEAKRLHLLTAYPLQRAQIYLGKWLGLFGFAVVGALAVLAVIGGCCLLLVARWPNAGERASLMSTEWRVQRQVIPAQVDIEARVRALFAERRQQGILPPGATLDDHAERLRDEVLREIHLLPVETPKVWQFAIGRPARHGATLRLKYRFIAGDRDDRVPLLWRIDAPDARTFVSEGVIATPHADNWLEIPWDAIPADGKVVLKLSRDRAAASDQPGINPEADIIFYRRDGVTLYHLGGSFAGNLLAAFGGLIAHYAAILAVGLTIGVAFTMSVASFVAGVVYLLSLTSSFFQGFLRELAIAAEITWVEAMGRLVIRLGTFFTTGLEPPGVIAPLSRAIAIGPTNLGMHMTQWFGGLLLQPVALVSDGAYQALIGSGIAVFVGFGVYLALAVGVGLWLVTRKELDRVH